MPIGLRLGWNAAGQRVEHVGRLVDLAAWLPGVWKHLSQGRPEAQGPIPDGQLRSDRQAPQENVPGREVRGATPARSAGSRESRPSPRSEAGQDRLPQLRQSTPRSPTPGPPRRPSTHRPSTSRPGAVVARPTRRRRPPATRSAQPASGVKNQPWCQRLGVSLRRAGVGGVARTGFRAAGWDWLYSRLNTAWPTFELDPKPLWESMLWYLG
jgi:hypothetical protein